MCFSNTEIRCILFQVNTFNALSLLLLFYVNNMVRTLCIRLQYSIDGWYVFVYRIHAGLLLHCNNAQCTLHSKHSTKFNKHNTHTHTHTTWKHPYDTRTQPRTQTYVTLTRSFGTAANYISGSNRRGETRTAQREQCQNKRWFSRWLSDTV